ncbi:MAG: hypothetical protein K2X27_13280 [Candidatus Obscuribacterales bacterium]|nr:hypothetical protein [Candidatus Obscuribacterales bacterium]
MDIRVKALVVLFPFIIAAYVGFSLLQPAIDESASKDTSLSEKRTEKETLDGKLAGLSKLNQQRDALMAEVKTLRQGFSKTPDVDLLNIDLERMCKETGMTMVGLEPSKEETEAKTAKLKEEEDKATLALKAKKDKLKSALAGGAAADAGAPAEKKEKNDELVKVQLENSNKNFIVIGDYDGLEKLVNQMELYQRPLEISEITLGLPKKAAAKGKLKIEDGYPADGEPCGDPRLLFITMKINNYYIPTASALDPKTGRWEDF